MTTDYPDHCDYEYRLDPADETRIQVRRKPTRPQRQQYRPSENWRPYNVPCATPQDARRVLAMLVGDGAESLVWE